MKCYSEASLLLLLLKTRVGTFSTGSRAKVVWPVASVPIFNRACYLCSGINLIL